MAISKKQQELDIMKWTLSVEKGKDACGSFNFCSKCDKSLENPCEKAYNKFYAKKPVAKKPVAKKAAPAKKAEVKPQVKATAQPAKATVQPAKAPAKPATKKVVKK